MFVLGGYNYKLVLFEIKKRYTIISERSIFLIKMLTANEMEFLKI